MMGQQIQGAISPSQIDPMLINDSVPYDEEEKSRIIRGLENFKGDKSSKSSMAPFSPSMMGQQMMGQQMMGQQMMGQPMMGQPMMGQPMMAPMSPSMGQQVDPSMMGQMGQAMSPSMAQSMQGPSDLAQGLSNFM